jgi:hypothetical protein
LFASSCQTRKKRINTRITLWRKDKIPYGAFYAYENVGFLFPKASINLNGISPARNFSIAENVIDTLQGANKLHKAYVILSTQVIADQEEINAMMNFVSTGNYLFISTFFIGDSLLKAVDSSARQTASGMFFLKDSMDIRLKDPNTGEGREYAYPGIGTESGFSALDSHYAAVLGTNSRGVPNFIRYNFQHGGAVFLHLAPMAFTNFFLLHKDNKTYFDKAMSYIPVNINELDWDDYFRKPREFSRMRFMFSKPPFAWAIGLILLLFFILYVFESKRKQRVIPKISPLKNSSLDFVKTVGRLYYQRKDNLNLAGKMIMHFLGHIRSQYGLPTTNIDEAFAEKLSYRSGCNRLQAGDLVNNIRFILKKESLSDEELMQFNTELESFYKTT